MLFEGRQRAAVIDRCWSIYLSITRVLSVPENFHIEFPAMVESAIISGMLQFTVGVGGDLRFNLREEYVFEPPTIDSGPLQLQFDGRFRP